MGRCTGAKTWRRQSRGLGAGRHVAIRQHRGLAVWRLALGGQQLLEGGVTWIMSSEELLCDVPHLGWLKVAGTLASVARRDTG